MLICLFDRSSYIVISPTIQYESRNGFSKFELERQNDRFEAFAGTVSHDLRNPLTLASGHLASLEPVVADEARLCLFFENAFRNAREHVGEDVTATVSRTGDGFVVGDDGPGIPPAEREAVLESGYSTAAEGTGFGLAIVSEVVEAHGWSMAIGESDTGGLQLSIAFEE